MWIIVEFFDKRELGRGRGVGRLLDFENPASRLGQSWFIVIKLAPLVDGGEGRARARLAKKAADAYGWDFQTEPVSIGRFGGISPESISDNSSSPFYG